MRTLYLSTIMAGLLSAAVAVSQELPSKQKPLPDQIPQGVSPSVPVADAGSPPPNVLPVPKVIGPGQTLPEGAAVPAEEGLYTLPPGISPPGDFPPDGPPAPDNFNPFAFPLSRFWISATYLHWWAKDDLVPPLLTLGNSADAMPGALGQPGTRIIFANLDDEESRAGIRVNLGFILDQENFSTMELSFLHLANRSAAFAAPPGNNMVLARPYVDANTLTENAFVVFNPDSVQGSVSALARTDIWGGELNFRARKTHSPTLFFHFLGGLRYFQLNDSLRIEENSTKTGILPLGRAENLSRFDEFTSVNRFFGAQVGLEGEWFFQRFIVNVYGKIAAGINHEDVSIRGGTAATNLGVSLPPLQTGFLANQTNIGDYSQGRFGLLGDFGLTMGYQLTSFCRVSVGYNRIYWNSVARAGQQIDRTLNPTQFTNTGVQGTLVGEIRPAFFFRETDFWVQGVNFTLEFRY